MIQRWTCALAHRRAIIPRAWGNPKLSFVPTHHARFPKKNYFYRIVWDSKFQTRKRTGHTSASCPQEPMTPVGRMTNPLQWFPTNLNFPMFPSLPPLPFNFMNIFGNQGALGAAVSPATFVPSNPTHAQSAAAQAHQQPARGAESELDRTQEYQVSSKPW